ncbi:MAG: oxygen-independent coproporphyrinogen III oxidase [Betaproteobacteria bacterium]|nr:oxygen-independent coproporphyrinogen III oxidase [Betaproteobacteria bacterium]MDE2131882.1 oxygen-independent coproporphyrinogen III oxidase [Betaproteobacteria bacterium]MDE2211510.1 oxygen-independent coproporphyrinogen III oxidase [Betaproteobacteria bacterium]
MSLISPSLMQRFDIPGPRYTSYPTADRFLPDSEASAFTQALAQRVAGEALPLSLYVHLPFCESVCYYCGCNKVITKDHSKSRDYLGYLEKESALVSERLGKSAGRRAAVAQLHLGGGSPTFLSDEELGQLVAGLKARFDFQDDAECSIEIDPRTVDDTRLAHLRRLGFNRLSFGVQDFDPVVQAAVHRVQPYEQVAALMESARALQFDSINVDLIYGLPHQNPESFARTLDQVIALRPDRIALYAYAHLPARFKPQRRIDAAALPGADLKLQMLDDAIRRFIADGYEYIGMDHFALPEDQLARVKRDGLLQRNFQGYHANPGADLLGLGVSAISQVGRAYSQNVKTLAEYYAALDAGRLPVERGLTLNDDDLVRRDVIMRLMCQGRVNFEAVERRYGIHFETYFEDALMRIREFEQFGLVARTPAGLEVSKTGWFFVRAVAMAFDKYLWLHADHQRFSKVL